MNYFSSGDDKKDRIFFVAIMGELIKYKFGTSKKSCEERAEKITKFFEQRHKELLVDANLQDGVKK